MYPIVQKPILEPVIDRTGAINYSAGAHIDPLVSLDMVREVYDMQAKSLRTIIDEIYNSIAGINSGIERFQSDIDRTNSSYTLFQRTVNAQIENIKHTIDNAQNQTTLQLTSFSDRIDYIEKQCDSMRASMLDHKQSIDDVIDTLNRNVNACRREVDKVMEQFADQSKAIQAVEAANISNEERINGILNHLIPNLSKEMEYHNGQIIKMLKDYMEKSGSTDEDFQKQIDTAQESVDEFLSALNDEKIRAQGVEINLQEQVQGNANRATETAQQITDRLDSHDTDITRTNDRLGRETDRATGVEDSLRNQIMAEAARSTSEESSIKTDLKSITDILHGNVNGLSSELHKAMATEIDDRKEADEALRVDYEDQFEKVHAKIEDVRATLTESIIDGDDREKRDRIDKDIALGNRIDDLVKKFGQEIAMVSTTVAGEIERSAALDADFNERLTRAHGDQLSTNGQNNAKFSEILKEIRELHRRLDKFVETSTQATAAIEEKMKQANAVIITRIENLDNRIDSEINRARKNERHFCRRLDVMEGIPTDDESDEPEPSGKTDQGLMISDTDKED